MRLRIIQTNDKEAHSKQGKNVNFIIYKKLYSYALISLWKRQEPSGAKFSYILNLNFFIQVVIQKQYYLCKIKTEQKQL